MREFGRVWETLIEFWESAGEFRRVWESLRKILKVFGEFGRVMEFGRVWEITGKFERI